MRNRMIISATIALAALTTGKVAWSQTVNAPYAQHLVTSTMSSHPELQKLGIHVTPPGGQDDVIVACSVPSKIGKKSSPADLEVEHSGKASVKTVTEQKFYDLALPLADAQKQPIGMIVLEMRFSGAHSSEESLSKAQNIVKEIESQIPSLKALFDKAPAN